MSPTNTPDQAAQPTDASGAVQLSPNAVKAYESMLAAVPDVDAGSYERILETIAGATDLAGLDAPWRSDGMGAYIDQPLLVRGIAKAPSDFAGALPWFLVVDAVKADTGEAARFTTGSVNVVAQLVKAYAMGAFPVAVIPRQSDRPTKDGYHPQRLQFTV